MSYLHTIQGILDQQGYLGATHTLRCLFVWSHTPEGLRFWSSTHSGLTDTEIKEILVALYPDQDVQGTVAILDGSDE